MHEPVSATSIAAHGGIAFFGAVVHAARAHQEGKSRSFLDFCILTMMSSFSGVMFALLGFSFFEEQKYLTLALAGTGGFLGVEGMTIVILKMKSLLK